MPITFQVDDVTKNTSLLPAVTARADLSSRGISSVEACSLSAANHVKTLPYHGFLMAAHTAYERHYALRITPDDIWLCLAQGLAAHIEQNAEALRSRLVRHQGTINLAIRRDDFVKGSPKNDWPGVFAELSAQIKEHIGGRRDLFVSNFSTTDLASRAASEIVLFSAMQKYFTYQVWTRERPSPGTTSALAWRCPGWAASLALCKTPREYSRRGLAGLSPQRCNYVTFRSPLIKRSPARSQACRHVTTRQNR